MRKTHLFVFLAIATISVAAPPLSGQTGRITGQVVDPTGASVPGAVVTVTNLTTGIKMPVSTNSEGYYTFPLLDPGYYSIAVAQSGFKTTERSGIKLDVGQIARIDFQLVVGEQAERVNVTEEAPLVQSESTAIGQVISEKAVLDLPLNGRNFTQLTTLTPGAFLGGITGFVRGSTVIANGMRTSNTVFVINGINITDQDFEGTAILPPPDAIQEFKVQTNNLGAQSGLGGMVIGVDLKSGTNAFHGVLYEFLRNDALDARNFFSPTTPALKQNQFGLGLGGPIRRDRTFFFADYSGTRNRNGQTFNSVVASPAMRRGDFSGPRAITDPSTGHPFPNNQIPPNRVSPQAAFFLPFFPLPNTLQGTYVRTATGVNDNNQFDVRIDQQLTNSGNLKFTYMFLQPSVFVPGAFPENGAVATALRHQSAGVSEVHILRPGVVNEITLGYARFRSFGAQQSLGTNYTVQSGIGGFELTSGAYPGFPGLTPSGFAGLNGNNFQPLRFRENNFNLRDLVAITCGKHTIETGMDMTWHANFTTNSARSRGNFTFTGGYTGNSFADFLLGIPFQGERSFPRDLFGYYTSAVEPFIQDSWKLTPRLTLNLGLRYSLFPRPTAMHNVLSSVDPVANQIVVASDAQGRIRTEAQQVAQFVFPLFAGIIVPSSQAGLDRSLRNPNWNNFGPRFGIAWQPGGDYVLRLGYGVIYSVYQGVQYEGTVAGANLPFFADQLGIFNTTPAPSRTLGNFFPPISVGAFTLPPLTFFQLDANSPNAYFHQWNFAIQKVLGSVVSVEGAYVGNKGTRLVFSRPINIPLPGPGPIQNRRPNPTFAAGSLIQETDNSIYHGFQGKVETRSWRGLNLLSTFTWAKGLDYQNGDFQVSPVQDPDNLRAERSVINQPAVRYTLGAVYELPLLKKRTDLPGQVLGGWQLTSILARQSGLPFTPTISTDPANTGTSKRPNRIRNGALALPTIDRWFDIAAFQIPAPFTYGNSGVNILYGPGRTDWDFGLFKNFSLSRIYEPARLQFRAEFFNFPNTPRFGSPTSNIQSPAAGKILSADRPREIQFALKLIW